MILYGCCVGSQEKLAKFVLPWLGARPLIATYNQTSIITAYNAILDVAKRNRETLDTLDTLVLVHDDLEILDPGDAEAKILATFADPSVALAGVAGGGRPGQFCPELYWWNHAPVGHQRTDVADIDFGRRTGEVSLLEGSLLAFAPWAVGVLRFDHLFDDCDFHGYDEISAQAVDAGYRVVVVDVDTHHHNPMGYRSAESAAACARANALYREKWGLG